MKTNLLILAIAFGLAASASPAAGFPDPEAMRAVSEALGAARARRWPAAGALPERRAAQDLDAGKPSSDDLFEILKSQELPRPDPSTLEWLRSRAPDIDLKWVRLVPETVALEIMGRAAAAGGTYLDLFSHKVFRGELIYFVARDVLAAVDRKYAAGTLPISGRTKDGRPFLLEAFLAGSGRMEFLYNHDGFDFEEDGRTYRLDSGSRVTCRLQGEGDVAVSGISVHAFLWKFAKIQRILRIAPLRVRVETDMGSAEGDLHAIRER